MASRFAPFSSILVAACILLSAARSSGAEECIDVAPVWSGHPVGFSLLSTPKRQFVAFYDAERKLTVASRWLAQKTWRFVTLPETVGWDSHNYIAMAVDDNGDIHLCANMHAVPLIYFRTRVPWDVRTFRRIPAMVGREETRCTYPQFFRGPGNEFIFTYRSGGAGNGDQFYNVYDHKTKTWKRLLDTPLTSGEGKMNAYFTSLRPYPDGYYHLAWVWRDPGCCSLNHDISYARSKDLIHWETSAGKPLELPITLGKADIVDPIPVKGGLLNGGVRVGLDTQQRVVVSYHKFDERGNNQVYNARLEDGRWKVYQTSDWDYRWYFSGGGSIITEIRVGTLTVEPDGRVSLAYQHPKYGNGKWILDEKTLKPIEQIGGSPASAPASDPPEPNAPPKLEAKASADAGSTDEPGVRYVLRWETLGPNRDRPREGTLPGPSMLRLCRQETAPAGKK